MAIKPKLFLHIGTHKTGSTSIQRGAYRYSNELRELGILYPSTEAGDNPHLPKHDFLFTDAHAGDAVFAAAVDKIVSEFEQSGCHSMILSEEGLSEPIWEHFDKMRLLADFFDIETICYFQRPDYFMETLWVQKCVEGHFKGHILDFINAPFNQMRIRYFEVCEFWSDFSTMQAFNFDDVKSGGVMRHFFQAIGAGALEVEELRFNPSASVNCGNFLSALNRLEIDYNVAKVVNMFSEDRSKRVLGRRPRVRLLDRVRDDLEKMEAKYGVQFDLTLPEETEGALLRLPPEVAAKAFARFLT